MVQVLFSFEGTKVTSQMLAKTNIQNKSGDNDAEVPPVPIPNTEVKLCSADDTWREAARESRSSPEQKRSFLMRLLFLFCIENQVKVKRVKL